MIRRDRPNWMPAGSESGGSADQSPLSLTITGGFFAAARSCQRAKRPMPWAGMLEVMEDPDDLIRR